ncbi:MAG TPA: hemolysin [Porphyromonadaceae bacterium]|nr:hemolysin [Porphyromonadaceae bacterium]
MQDIIKPVDVELIKSELTSDKFLRKTNKANNELYIITHHDSPNVMREIGRLREIAFRFYGGGTGQEVDIDEYDTNEEAPYRQLIVWCPESEKILGGYRFICGSDVIFEENGQPYLATSHMFDFSEEFIKDYLPYTVELGRSFVTLEFQSTLNSKKGVFVLDNLWDGLGALSVIDPSLKYFFGKMTMYDTYNKDARDMVLYFLKKHFPDPDNLVVPIQPLPTQMDINKMESLFNKDNYKDNYKVLNTEVRKFGINIPPLVSAYMSLSPNMKVFGTAINDEFGNVEETGILITICDILEDKRKRHMESFLLENDDVRSLIKTKLV